LIPQCAASRPLTSKLEVQKPRRSICEASSPRPRAGILTASQAMPKPLAPLAPACDPAATKPAQPLADSWRPRRQIGRGRHAYGPLPRVTGQRAIRWNGQQRDAAARPIVDGFGSIGDLRICKQKPGSDSATIRVGDQFAWPVLLGHPPPTAKARRPSSSSHWTIESRLPVAVALPLLAFVVRYAGEEHRAPIASRCLAF